MTTLQCRRGYIESDTRDHQSKSHSFSNVRRWPEVRIIHIGFMCFKFELRFNYRMLMWCCYICLAPDISTNTQHIYEWCEFVVLFLRICVQHHRLTHRDTQFSFYSLIQLIKSKQMRGKKRKPFSLPAVCRGVGDRCEKKSWNRIKFVQ